MKSVNPSSHVSKLPTVQELMNQLLPFRSIGSNRALFSFKAAAVNPEFHQFIHFPHDAL